MSSKRKIIAISGISGSGKTFIGSRLAIRLSGMHVDRDIYYKENKPKVRLSNGVVKSNWDTHEALDNVRMNEDLRVLSGLLILSGFDLSDEVFDEDNKPDVHIHLHISPELSLQTRLAVKDFNSDDKETHRLMFNEVVYPFYQNVCRSSSINKTINVEIDNSSQRRSGDDIVDEIIEYLKKIGIIKMEDDTKMEDDAKIQDKTKIKDDVYIFGIGDGDDFQPFGLCKTLQGAIASAKELQSQVQVRAGSVTLNPEPSDEKNIECDEHGESPGLPVTWTEEVLWK